MPFEGAIHVHSNYSHDSHDSLETLRDLAIQRRIRFIGMSEHAEDLTEEIFERYVAHCDQVSDGQVQIIPGLEFRFTGLTGMHLFALGLRRWMEPNTPDEFFEQTRSTAQLTVLAHPLLANYEIPQVVLDHVDAIEVWNTNYNTRYLPDPRAITLFHEVRRVRPEVIATVGLDQHDAHNDRNVRVVLPTPSDDPLIQLKAGRFFNRGLTMKFDSRIQISPFRLRTLYAMRTVYDVIERAQDASVRWIRGTGSPTT